MPEREMVENPSYESQTNFFVAVKREGGRSGKEDSGGERGGRRGIVSLSNETGF